MTTRSAVGTHGRTVHATKHGSDGSWMPQQLTAVLLLSELSSIQDQVAAVCAAAGVELVITSTEAVANYRSESFAALLVGEDCSLPLAWPGVVISIGLESSSSELWKHGLDNDADKVAFLPDSSQWLAQYLARQRGQGQGAHVVGVIGACGGAGASTTAFLLAASAAADSRSVMMLDADPWGGGVELTFAGEKEGGLRWVDLLGSRGTLNPEQLAAGLPQAHGVSVLSWTSWLAEAAPRSRLKEVVSKESSENYLHFGNVGSAREVLRAARKAFQLVVIDLARNQVSLSDFASECDSIVVVVPARLQAASAAIALKSILPPVPIALLVRGPLNEGVDAELVAQTIGIDCLGTMPHVRGLDANLSGGRTSQCIKQRNMAKTLSAIHAWSVHELGTADSRSQMTLVPASDLRKRRGAA